MSEDTQIISNEDKKVDLKSFFLNNKKSLITSILIILFALFAYFFYSDYKINQKVKISDQYNLAIINYDKDNPNSSISEMKNIIKIKDPTYSTLALYFLLDNKLLDNKNEINRYFDILINDVKLEKETTNLKHLINDNRFVPLIQNFLIGNQLSVLKVVISAHWSCSIFC